ncbi:hypothetical protein N9L68_01895 [bacterium]|nr:hypothetical protein [bacterium]
MAVASLDGVNYPDVAICYLNGFITSTVNANTTLTIVAPTHLVYTGGQNTNIDGSSVISCTLAPLDVSVDGTNHIPSRLAFVGFSGVGNAGVITSSGSNVTYYAGSNTSIDGSNTISCDLSPLTVSLASSIEFTGFATSVDGAAITIKTPSGSQTPSPGCGIQITNISVVNTKPTPAYIVAATGVSDNTSQPDVETQLKFNGFNHAFGSNILTISPEPQAPILAGAGISVSGRRVTKTKQRCDVTEFSGLVEVIIPGEQITAIKMP